MFDERKVTKSKIYIRDDSKNQTRGSRHLITFISCILHNTIIILFITIFPIIILFTSFFSLSLPLFFSLKSITPLRILCKLIMSGSPAVEIDFFRLNAESLSAPKKLSDRRGRFNLLLINWFIVLITLYPHCSWSGLLDMVVQTSKAWYRRSIRSFWRLRLLPHLLTWVSWGASQVHLLSNLKLCQFLIRIVAVLIWLDVALLWRSSTTEQFLFSTFLLFKRRISWN